MSDSSEDRGSEGGAEGADAGPTRDAGPKRTDSSPPSSGPAASGAASSRTPSEAVASDDVGGAAAPEPPPVDPLEAAKAEAHRFRDQLLRTAADFDNFRKRARRDADDAQRRGREGLLKELLPVFDNLERAATSADVASDVKSVAEGIRMVLRQFGSTLDRVGIQRVATVGKPFDPALHEAIQHIESTEHEAGLIAAEVQAGYQLGEHLVRAALVVVSKGPGPGAKADEGEGGSADGEGAAPGDAPN